ncbi:hypothetical protein J4221_05675 [Candidatus Pacearchaeota archaeon]|nr:hypothetical protein [Candidatus Pacearchaeota archaeon]
MKKILWILIAAVVIFILGITYYFINSPFTINSVKVPDSVDTYTKANVENMDGYLVTGTTNSFIKNCKYVTYNPESSLNHVYICKPNNNPEDSISSWINKEMNFLNQGNQKFTIGETEINDINVKTLTIGDENCGNPGYCTTYYWKQGKVIFSSNTERLVQFYISVN